MLVCPASCDDDVGSDLAAASSSGASDDDDPAFRNCQCSCPSLDARAPDAKTLDDDMVYVGWSVVLVVVVGGGLTTANDS